MKPTSFKKDEGCGGAKGIEFQVSLLTVFLLNALQKLNNWKLSTENKRAGKFDDVVLECSEGDTLLQAKTKEKKSKLITLNDLLSVDPTSTFGLLKYFMSYQTIKNDFNIKNVIICANIGFNSKMLIYLKKQYACSDSLLYYGHNDCAFYTFTDDIIPLLKKNVPTYVKNVKDKGEDIDKDVITEENFKDFFKHLQFYPGYPSGDRLDNAIKEILTNMKLRCQISSSEIHAKMMYWFLNKKSVHNEASAKAIFSEILRDRHWEMLKKYNIRFEHNDFDFLQPKRLFHVTTEGEHLLQEIKIYHALQENIACSLYINSTDDLEVQKQALEAFELRDYTFLIIVSITVKDNSATREIYHKLRDTLKEDDYKKVILVAPNGNKLLKEFSCDNDDHHIFDGRVTFKDLTQETREGIVKENNIKFQGEHVSLETLLSTKKDDDYEVALSRGILEKLIKNEEITVGRGLEKLSRFYINRTLVRNKEKQDETSRTSIRKEIVSEGNLCQMNDKVTLITDSAGMGKSTLLVKLAEVTKQQNPRLWVIRIELNHYTAYLRELLRNKGAVNVMELLQSSSATKLTNPLEKYALSLDGKIVLIFDGVDEISPDFTDLVVTALVQCLGMSNVARMFVTARPHMTELLEMKLQTKSFMLQPFTEQNQIDFLADYWVTNLGLDEEVKEKCKQYAKSLISKIDGYAIFTAIPLQVKMMAEIFQESKKSTKSTVWVGCKEYLSAVDAELKLQKNLNVAKLYELFIEKKMEVFVEKNNPSGNVTANQALVNQFNESLVYHRALALDSILNSSQVKHFLSYRKKVNDAETVMLKIGIVQKIGDDFHFLHQTFAEYFIADCIVRELQNHNRKVEFQTFFIDEILVDYKFNVVRTFLNNFLQHAVNFLPSDSLQEYKSHTYENHWLEWNNFHLIHNLAGEGHIAILCFLLKCIGFKTVRGKEIGIAELYGTDASDEIPMHMFSNTLKVLESLLTKAGLNIQDEKGHTPFYCAVKAGHIDMAKFLLKHGANINNEAAYRSLLHSAMWDGNLEVTEFLLKEKQIADWTDLGPAIENKQTHIVDYLFRRFLRQRRTENELMIAYTAAFLGRMDILRDLIEEGGLYVNSKIDYDSSSLIIAAARGKQLDVIRYLVVEQDAYISSKDRFGNTALQSILYDPSIFPTAQLLLDLGIDINSEDNLKETALHTAARMGNFELVRVLVENGADINKRNYCGSTAIHRAASGGQLVILKYLMDNDGDVNVTDDEGNTALHCAVASGDADTVMFLTTLEMDKNVKNKKGRTALHITAEEGDRDMVGVLVKIGLDIRITDNDGQTALHLAATSCADTIELLVRLGLYVNTGDKFGRTPLHLACKEGEWTCIGALLNNKADISVRDKYGCTPLFLGIQKAVVEFHDRKKYPSFLRQLELVRWLVDEHHADVNVGDIKGRTPLHEAVLRNQLYTVQFLRVGLKADINVKDKDGRTPLHLSVEGNLSVTKFLVEQGANVKVKDHKGKTAIDLAKKRGNVHLLNQEVVQDEPKCRRMFDCLKYCGYGVYYGSYNVKRHN